MARGANITTCDQSLRVQRPPHFQEGETDMNVNSSGAVSTLVPQPTAAGTGQSAGQNWAVSKEVENWATTEQADAPGAPQDSWATSQEATNWASSEGPEKPQIKAESWATSQEATNLAGDEPAPEPASQRVDIKV